MEIEKDLSKGVSVKAIKICAAGYRITDFFENDDPIRSKIRKSSTDLLDNTVSLSGSPIQSEKAVLKNIKDNISRLVLLYSVLNAIGIVSDDNSMLIKDKLYDLDRTVENYSGSSGLLNEDIFDVSAIMGMDMGVEHATAQFGADKRTLMRLHTSGGDAAIKNDRKAKILDFINKNGPTTIRDLTPVIKGCSDKTIQRELAGLVVSGLVRREGEKRWSRYLIAI